MSTAVMSLQSQLQSPALKAADLEDLGRNIENEPSIRELQSRLVRRSSSTRSEQSQSSRHAKLKKIKQAMSALGARQFDSESDDDDGQKVTTISGFLDMHHQQTPPTSQDDGSKTIRSAASQFAKSLIVVEGDNNAESNSRHQHSSILSPARPKKERPSRRESKRDSKRDSSSRKQPSTTTKGEDRGRPSTTVKEVKRSSSARNNRDRSESVLRREKAESARGRGSKGSTSGTKQHRGRSESVARKKDGDLRKSSTKQPYRSESVLRKEKSDPSLKSKKEGEQGGRGKGSTITKQRERSGSVRKRGKKEGDADSGARKTGSIGSSEASSSKNRSSSSRPKLTRNRSRSLGAVQKRPLRTSRRRGSEVGKLYESETSIHLSDLQQFNASDSLNLSKADATEAVPSNQHPAHRLFVKARDTPSISERLHASCSNPLDRSNTRLSLSDNDRKSARLSLSETDRHSSRLSSMETPPTTPSESETSRRRPDLNLRLSARDTPHIALDSPSRIQKFPVNHLRASINAAVVPELHNLDRPANIRMASRTKTAPTSLDNRPVDRNTTKTNNLRKTTSTVGTNNEPRTPLKHRSHKGGSYGALLQSSPMPRKSNTQKNQVSKDKLDGEQLMNALISPPTQPRKTLEKARADIKRGVGPLSLSDGSDMGSSSDMNSSVANLMAIARGEVDFDISPKERKPKGRSRRRRHSLV